MSVQSIIQFISSHVDHRGIPHIPNSTWLDLISQHSKQDIKDALAEYITSNNIPFPTTEISTEDFENLFTRFANTSMLGEYKSFGTVLEKHPYRYKYEDSPLGVLDKSHAYNPVSNYFQQANRMRCGSNQVDSPWTFWHNREKLSKMNYHFWRKGALGDSDVCAATFRSAFRIGTYTATQFRPSVAKAIYEKHDARRVLDTSCGWGDRLAGFYATPCTELYVGCDPNPEVYAVYKQQCVEYERLLGHTATLTEYDDHFTCVGSKRVEIWNLPSEDVNWTQYAGQFDLYFTSPPYFETEKYAEATSAENTQSWARYPTFDDWKLKFFFPVNRMIWNTLAPKAYMMINIVEPVNGKYKLCDDMVDDILTYPGANYIGKIGMRLQARPHSIVQADKNSVFVEPIWVFRKDSQDYEFVAKNTFDNLFSINI